MPGMIERDARILAATKRLIAKRGIAYLTRTQIADEAGLAASSVSNYGLASITNGDNPEEGYKTRILRGLLADAIDRKDTAMIRTVLAADGKITADAVPAFLRLAADV
jgi:hypothetical protein